VIIGFGGAAWSAIQGIGENRTPWAGGFERINAYAYFAWIIVLALTMIRRSLSQSETDAVEQSLYAEHEGWHKSAVEPFRQVVVKPIPPGCF
jgi:hypothetical protein